MVVFPSVEWMEELKRKVNGDTMYRQVAANWEGDFLCIVELDEEAKRDFSDARKLAGFLGMIFSLPAERKKKFAGTATGRLIEELGISLDSQPEDFEGLASKVPQLDVSGATLNIWMDFWHGELRNVEVAAPGEHEDARFVLSGPYAVFKQLVSGKADAMSLILGGKLKLRGDMAYMMRNMAAVRRFTELMSSIPIEG